ncbi:Protein of unknown function [Mesobacillus persicus]|uniref:DUF3219 domain-containing protein n=1 Tax=Mesobacillus persicus TaxID=930146 RepID=A0A1H7W108_9BACI|nr:DUF3219 family protein [Mesobacillus persicus]SEM15272.1 Protein of unknown function [Mesobacillus persicus]
MVNEIQLNQIPIQVYEYKEENQQGLHKISVGFKVTSEEYHDVATLLYKETFEVSVPERELQFKGKIINYSTSITNLYEKGQVGDYLLSLLEVQNEERRK